MLQFAASFTKEGKWYVARAVEFGVTTQGKTLEAAKKNLLEAVELFLQGEPKATKRTRSEPPLLTILEAKL